MKRLEKFYPEVDDKFKWSKYNTLKGVDHKQKIDDVFLFIQNDLSNEEDPFTI